MPSIRNTGIDIRTQVENRVQNDRRQQAKTQKDESPHERGPTSSTKREYDGKAGIVGVRRAEDDCLQNQRQADEDGPMAEARAN